MQEPKIIVGDVAIDSKQIQLLSLTNFARVLGYEVVGDKGKYHFSSDNKRRTRVSFQTMVKMHNTNCSVDYYWKMSSPSTKPSYIWNIPPLQAQSAIDAKVVHTIYIQHKRKTNQLVCHKMWVKFTDPAYEALLQIL